MSTYGWGESVVWDERRQRLYWVDCLASTLHWQDHGSHEVQGRRLSSMPTGVVPVEGDDRLLIVMDDGLRLVDADTGDEALVAAYPPGLGGGRCNDACADLDGNVVTGKLNLGPAEGGTWQWSATRDGDGWTLLDADISNTNGPTVAVLHGRMTLLVGDTAADYYAYDYDPAAGTVGSRRVFGAMADAGGGAPDGATLDADGGYWCALVGGGQLVRYTTAGLDRRVPLDGMPNPTDLTFGGPDLDRLYVTAIDGPLLVLDGLGVAGRPEPRARL